MKNIIVVSVVVISVFLGLYLLLSSTSMGTSVDADIHTINDEIIKLSDIPVDCRPLNNVDILLCQDMVGKNKRYIYRSVETGNRYSRTEGQKGAEWWSDRGDHPDFGKRIPKKEIEKDKDKDKQYRSQSFFTK